MAPDVFISQNKIAVHTEKLPGNVKAFSMPYHDGYVIVVNDCLCSKARRKALRHELYHIKQNEHFNPEYLEYDE